MYIPYLKLGNAQLFDHSTKIAMSKKKEYNMCETITLCKYVDPMYVCVYAGTLVFACLKSNYFLLIEEKSVSECFIW